MLRALKKRHWSEKFSASEILHNIQRPRSAVPSSSHLHLSRRFIHSCRSWHSTPSSSISANLDEGHIPVLQRPQRPRSTPRSRTSSMIVPKEMDGGGRQWPFSHRPRLLLILVIRPLFFSAFSTAPCLPCFIQAALLRLLREEEPPRRQRSQTNPILPSSSVAVIYARQTCSVTLSSPRFRPLLVYFGWHAQRGAHSRSAAASCLAPAAAGARAGRRLT